MPDRRLSGAPTDTLALSEESMAELAASGLAITVEDVGPREDGVELNAALAGAAATLRVATYELREKIGEGGMGEVWRAWDGALQRTVALKVLRPEVASRRAYVDRFIEEARATGGLQHPGILPVHDLFLLPDGRPAYAMREVEGRTLDVVIAAAHAFGPARTDGVAIQRLLRVYEQVCRAMAYAHAHHVVHRDLKPQNIMLGPFGEVCVLDWGLARPLHRVDAVVEELGGADVLRTRAGALLGTPVYMAPEQASPAFAPLSLATDVYALGAVLYELLVGKPPVSGPTVTELLDRIVVGAIDPLPPALGVPADLAELCMRALALEPAERFPDAGALADAMAAVLEGQTRRAAASRAVAAADGLRPKIEALRGEARRMAEAARDGLASLDAGGPLEQRRALWAAEDEARRLRREAELLSVQYVQALQGALATYAELPEARERLADHHRDELVEATRARDADAAARHAELLRAYDRGRHADWLAGRGALTVVTDPPGARVSLYRFAPEGRRLVPRFERDLGVTPLREVDLPPGSWLLRLDAPGRPPVRYPVEIGGDELWDGVPPGATAPLPVPLPAEGDLPEGVVYVPPGPARVGGDPRAPLSTPPGRRWIGGYLIGRAPVTNGEWLAMLNELAGQGDAELAARLAPRPPPGAALAYDWSPALPVRFVDAFAAEAFASWVGEKRGAGWRLPHDLEWEKAARGVDGRAFPWGDFLDPHWANMRDTAAGGPAVQPTGAFPDDVSVYGLLGAAGNVRCWTADPAGRPGARLVRGGWFGGVADDCRAAARASAPADARDAGVGVRLVRSWP